MWANVRETQQRIPANPPQIRRPMGKHVVPNRILPSLIPHESAHSDPAIQSVAGFPRAAPDHMIRNVYAPPQVPEVLRFVNRALATRHSPHLGLRAIALALRALRLRAIGLRGNREH